MFINPLDMIEKTLDGAAKAIDGAVGIVDSSLKLEPPAMNDVLQMIDGGMSVSRTAATLGCDEELIVAMLKEAHHA